jgi:hypothetical protein
MNRATGVGYLVVDSDRLNQAGGTPNLKGGLIYRRKQRALKESDLGIFFEA